MELYNGKYKWSIFYEKQSDGTMHIVTNHGTTNGKMVEHISIIKEGKNIGKKNETSIEEQAKLEVERECVKKKKQGYHLKNENDNENDNETENCILKPMLALEYKKEKEKGKLKFPVWAQPKLDGVRCLIYMKQGELVFQSRQNTIYDPIEHLVPDLTSLLSRMPGAILDGELYTHQLGFENIISMVRRAKVKHPDIVKLKYHLYDMFYLDKSKNETETKTKTKTKTMPYAERFDTLFKNYKNESNVVLVETTCINSSKEIEFLLNDYIQKSYEGLMIRGNGPYKNGRSKDLLKYKLFQDAEFEVVGHHEGHNGIPVFDCKVGETTFGVMMKGDVASRQDRMKNVKDYYGKMLTVKYQELSADGIPRFPVGIAFRDYE